MEDLVATGDDPVVHQIAEIGEHEDTGRLGSPPASGSHRAAHDQWQDQDPGEEDRVAHLRALQEEAHREDGGATDHGR